MQKLIKILGNPKIFVGSIMWLMILVVLGTLAQRDIGLYAAQQKYFSTYIAWFGDLMPVPTARTTMIIIVINLMCMLTTHNIWKLKKIGVLIVHLGALLLLIGGGVTAMFSSEGNIIIEEGSSSNYVIDYHDMELALIDKSLSDYDIFTVFDQSVLKKGNILKHDNLSFEIEVISLIENCSPERRTISAGVNYKGLLKNFMFNELKPEKEDSRNTPGLMFEIQNSETNINGIYGLFLNQSVAQNLVVQDKKFELIFRRKQTYLPFTLELVDFKKIEHPGTGIAKSYSSDVNLIENNIPRRVLIQMNEPLRHRGYTFFQSSFIEGLDVDVTVLAAVKNYGRLFPYIASIIMCIGLLLHLLINLPKLIKKNISVSAK